MVALTGILHTSRVVRYWNQASVGSSLCTQWPVNSIHDHDDGGSARSEQFVASSI